MSTSRKVIKFFSILSLVGGLIMLVAAVLVGLDIWDNSTMLLGVPADQAHFDGVATAVIGAVQGIVQLIVGWLGIKGANRPSKIGGFLGITVIAVVYYAVCTVLGITSKSGNMAVIGVGLVWHVIMLIMALNVRKEAQR